LLAARDRSESGDVEAARIRVAGNIVGFRAVFTTPEAMASTTRGLQDRMNRRFEAGGGPDLCWKSPAQIYAQMTRYVEQGVDFVKYGATGDDAPVNSSTGQWAVLRFSPDQQRAIVEAVHAKGKTVQTHTTSAESVHIAVEVGNDIGQHVSFTCESRLYDQTIELMLERGYHCGTQWAPLTDEQLQVMERRDFPGDDRFNGVEGYSYELENSIRLIEAGVPQFVSTDSIVFDPDVADDADWGGLGGHKSISGEAQFLVMQSMSQRGMTNMQIIQSATSIPAKAYHVDREIGTLEPGKIADMIVVGSSPLEQITNLRDLRMVLKSGQVIDFDALPTSPLLTSVGARHRGLVRSERETEATTCTAFPRHPDSRAAQS
jgi:imidazolonepropionase-like amidohydrolase